jgi:hypothetical protein
VLHFLFEHRKSDLEALHTILEKVVAKLEEGFNAAIEEDAESMVELHRESGKPADSMDWARQVVRERLKFMRKETTVELVSSDHLRLKDSSLFNILKDPKVDLLNPIGLNIRFQRGPCELRMDVYPGGIGGIGGEIYVEVGCGDDSICSDIWHLIKGWLDSYSPNFFLRLFVNVAPVVWILLGWVLLYMLLMDFMGGGNSRESQYQQKLQDRAKALLTEGINSNEVEKALTTILEMQSKIIPDSFVAKAESPFGGLRGNTVLVGISLLLSIATPRTVIGLGKKRKLSILYKNWIALIMTSLPTSIGLPWLFEKLL